MRVLVPVQQKLKGFHPGHLALFEYAKNIGTPEIVVVPSTVEVSRYVRQGVGVPTLDNLIVAQMEKEISRLKLKVTLVEPQIIDESYRIGTLSKVCAFVKTFHGSLLLPHYISMCEIYLFVNLSGYLRVKNSEGWAEGLNSVRGPEVPFFFLKKIGKLFGFPSIHIMPKFITNEFGIRYQSTLDGIQDKSLDRLDSMVRGARDKFKVGLNVGLAKEMREAYSHKPFKVRDIAVFEGDLVDGRLEVVTVEVRTEEGITIVEHCKYEE